MGSVYALMFDVQDGGVSNPVPWGKQNLTSDKIIMTLDEQNQIVWLWYGKQRGLVSRRTALRQAESLKGHGYTIGKSIIGRDLKEIVEIEERKIGMVPDVTAANEKFMTLLSMEVHEVGNSVVAFGASGGEVLSTSPIEKPKTPVISVEPKTIPKPAAPAPAVPPQPKPATPAPVVPPQPKPEPKPNAPAVIPAPASVPAPKSPPKPEIKAELNGDISLPEASEFEEDNISVPKPEDVPVEEKKSIGITDKEESEMGLVIMAVLSQIKDIWVSKKPDGTIYLERMEGKICSFNIENGKVKFAAGSFAEIDAALKEAIQKKFYQLVASCK